MDATYDLRCQTECDATQPSIQHGLLSRVREIRGLVVSERCIVYWDLMGFDASASILNIQYSVTH